MFDIDYLNRIDDGQHRKEVLAYFESFNPEEQDYYFCLRFIFFCWHVVNCGESVSHKSLEYIMNKDIENRIDDIVIDGLSCDYLRDVSLKIEDVIVKKFLCTNPEYDALLTQMINVFFYHFSNETQQAKESIIKIAYLKKPESVIVKKMYDKLINGKGDFDLTVSEKEQIIKFFPGDNRFSSYFKHLFVRDYTRDMER